MNILVFEKNEIHPKAIQLLKDNGFKILTETDDLKNKKEIDAIFIKTYTRITSNFLSQFPNLKYILRAGTGLDHIDLKACEKRNIKVINSPNANANAVSEFIISSMILLSRNILPQIKQINTGQWRNDKIAGFEIKSKTIGIIGFGAIGKLVSKKLQNFEIKKINVYDPYIDQKTIAGHNAEKCELDYLLKNSDIITLHLPLNAKTKDLLNKEKISLIKKSGLIINTSRGGIINEKDLILALKKNKIKGAALDVFENEPNINSELLSLPNTILTPHISGMSKESKIATSTQVVKNFLKILT